MPQRYIELNIPANPGGSHRLEKNALHIWPRKDFMLIALPNPDGTFTCTLFLNYSGDPSFESLKERADVECFFNENFADALEHLENPVDGFLQVFGAARNVCAADAHGRRQDPGFHVVGGRARPPMLELSDAEKAAIREAFATCELKV